MKVAIYGQSFQEEDKCCVQELLEELEKLDATICVEENFNKLVSEVTKTVLMDCLRHQRDWTPVLICS